MLMCLAKAFFRVARLVVSAQWWLPTLSKRYRADSRKTLYIEIHCTEHRANTNTNTKKQDINNLIFAAIDCTYI